MSFTKDELPVILNEFTAIPSEVLPIGTTITGSIEVIKKPSRNMTIVAISHGGSNKTNVVSSTGVTLTKYSYPHEPDDVDMTTNSFSSDTTIDYSIRYLQPNNVRLRFYFDGRSYAEWDSLDSINGARLFYFDRPYSAPENMSTYETAAPSGNQYALIQYHEGEVVSKDPGIEVIQLDRSTIAVKIPEIGEDKVTSWNIKLRSNSTITWLPKTASVTVHRIKAFLENYNFSIDKGKTKIKLTPEVRWGGNNTPHPNMIRLEPVDPNNDFLIRQYWDTRGTYWELEFAENTGPTRTAQYKIKYGEWEDSEIVTVTQEGSVQYYFEVTPTSIYSSKDGDRHEVIVRTNMQYKMEAKSNITSWGLTWYTVSKSGSGEEFIYTITTQPNPSCNKNLGKLIFTPTGRPAVEVDLIQESSMPYLIYEPSSTEIDSEAHTWEAVRRSNISAITETENLLGITYTKEEISPYPNQVIKYIFSASKNIEPRDKISYLESSATTPNDRITARYTITQRSNIVFDVLDVASREPVRNITVPADRTYVNIIVAYNVGFDSESNDDWIKCNIKQPSPTGTLYLESYFIVEENTGGPREGTITFTSPRGGTIVLNIHQEGYIEKSIRVTPNDIVVNSDSHIITLTVEASHDWNLIQNSEYVLPEWLSVNKTEGAAGITEVLVNIQQSLLKKRDAMLYFKLKDFPKSDVATIIQNAIENGYDITDIEDGSDWSKRKEAKIRDKYLKIRVRYTGNDLAVITALKTLYETSFA